MEKVTARQTKKHGRLGRTEKTPTTEESIDHIPLTSQQRKGETLRTNKAISTHIQRNMGCKGHIPSLVTEKNFPLLRASYGRLVDTH